MDDPYKTLGVARDASQEFIRKAYLKLAKQHHPDLNPGNAKAEERFKSAAAANELLSDPIRRGRFDRGEIDAAGQERPRQSTYRDYADGEAGRRYDHAGPQAGGWGAEDFGDLFSSIFEGGGAGKAPRRGRDEHFVLNTAFLEAVNGASRRLTMPDGRVLDVKIPAGAAHGQSLRLRGQGGGAADGAAKGDALIELHVAPHRYFTRDGQDIRLDFPVSLPEMVLGGMVEIPTPGGKVRMRIPPHSEAGAELRLRGRGVPAHGGQAAGDLYARLRVVIGAPDPALDAFLKAWTPDHPADPRRDMEAGS